MIHDIHGFEMFSCNILKIGWYPLNSIQGIFLEMQNVTNIFQQTYEGFRITVNLIIEAVQFLLQHEVSYILTERFCKNPLENYFGHQRSHGGRKDNPSLQDFVLNNNAIRNQEVFRPIAGNVRGGQDQNNVEFSCEPIPCRKKAEKETRKRKLFQLCEFELHSCLLLQN